MARITFKAAADELREMGVSLNRTAEPGEFRVSLIGVRPSKAPSYYTTDLADAVGTGRAMATEHGRRAA